MIKFDFFNLDKLSRISSVEDERETPSNIYSR